MKVTKLLKKDHDKVRALFKEYESAGERAHQSKRRLVETISQELAVHAKLEEELFYPVVKAVRAKEAKDTVSEAIEEHEIVKRLLLELAELGPEDEQYDAKVKVLQENVEHHAKEEEREMFPVAEDHLSDDELMELATELESRKELLLEEQPATLLAEDASRQPSL